MPLDLRRPLGRLGAAAPTAPAPRVDQACAKALVERALRGLEQMYDPDREALYSVTCETADGQPVRVEHLGLRYTVMSSLGLFEARRAGFSTPLDPAALLRSGVAQHPGDPIDHLAMALWADVTLGAGVAERVLPRLLRALETELDGTIGRVLAWALTGLSRYAEQDPDPAVTAAARRLRDLAVQRCWRPEGRLFDHFLGGHRFWRTQALFSTQIYWVIALAEFGRIFNDSKAISVAEQTMDQLIALRDPFFGWPWRYDAVAGRVVERYPVYSVHQDGMAPMALHALSRATGRDYGATHQESLGWLWRNELGRSMLDPTHPLIYRAIRRSFPLNRAAYGLGQAAAFLHRASPVADKPWALRLNATCRPYHLGWVLHAWAEHLTALPA